MILNQTQGPTRFRLDSPLGGVRVQSIQDRSVNETGSSAQDAALLKREQTCKLATANTES